ncbi:unnamed protein product [Periconia digitata]|uniref:UDP-glucose 6-dehydrogenase n=1 Tax=Periconia digitata TaxID=1303443 RepID=A0A9W4XX97_9PLEO|nr:unnamed protein product [Periconia digitata]
MHTQAGQGIPVPVTITNSTNFDPQKTRTPQRMKKVCCIGAGYVGGPTSAVMATKNPDVSVTVVDYNKDRIEAWKTNELPIYEPDLLDVVQHARDPVAKRIPNLFFSTDVEGAIAEADIILLSVNTPTKSMGHGAGQASELCHLESAVRRIGEVATSDKIIVEKSTVPCKAAETVRDILNATAKPGLNFEILSNPEFLAEGTAVRNLLHPDRILIGSLNTPRGLAAARSLADLYASWVDRSRIITINLYSSELAKLAANALLAQRISSVNALSAMCESLGADIDEVSHCVGLDQRIGPKMLKASVGFGGSCFRKDILSLAYIAESLHLPQVADYWRSIVGINEYQKERFTRRIVKCLYSSLSSKRLAVLGFAYKKDTGDTRETSAITVVNNLINEGANVRVYDPLVEEDRVWEEVLASSDRRETVKQRLSVWPSAYEACADADAVIILTEWDEFSNKISGPGDARGRGGDRTKRVLDWSRVAGLMQKPMYVFDGRNVLDAAPLEKMGFRVESIGKGVV